MDKRTERASAAVYEAFESVPPFARGQMNELLAKDIAVAVIEALDARDAEVARASFVCCHQRAGDPIMFPGDYCFDCPNRPAGYVERTAWQKFKSLWGFTA